MVQNAEIVDRELLEGRGGAVRQAYVLVHATGSQQRRIDFILVVGGENNDPLVSAA